MLDAADGSAAGAARDPRLEEFLAVVEQLRAVPVAEPRPEFSASLRAELMSAADTLLVPADGPLVLPARNTRRDRRIAAAIGSIAVVGAGTSMAVAAQSALPGEMLYPLKRAIEDAETGVSSPETRGLTMLDQATSRLLEVEALGQQGQLDDDSLVVSSSLSDFSEQATEAADYILTRYEQTGQDELVRDLRDFTGSSMTTLEDLGERVPDSARDELAAAVEAVAAIDARAREACPTCGGQGVEEVPTVLLSSAAREVGSVLVPGATVKAWEPRSRGGRSGGGKAGSTGGGEESSTGGGVDAAPTAPTAPDTGTTAPGSGTTDPVTELTETLTGGSDSPISNGGKSGGLGKSVDKTVKDVTDGVKKGVEDVEDGLEDATGGLIGD